MSKCEQCIVRDLSALKALTKDELIKMSDCKTAKIFKKGDVVFEEGQNVNGVFASKKAFVK